MRMKDRIGLKRVDRYFYKEDRDAILLKQKGMCANPYCRAMLTRETATMDHIVPRKKVKYHSAVNCVVLCYRCNQRKGCGDTIELTDYEKAVQKMLNAIDRRIRQAIYRLSFDTKGGFRKWEDYHMKRGKWI